MRLLLAALLVLGVVAQDFGPDDETSTRLRRAETPAMRAFHKLHGERPGYVVDHIIPLCAGGPDAVENLQWQARAASYRKDTFERQLCREMKRQGYKLVKVN